MSALCMIRCDDGIVLASDGAACDDQGRLSAEVSKVALLPEYDCILASRGAGNITATLHSRIQILAGVGFGISGFDDVLAALPDLARHLHGQLLTETGAQQHWTTLVGGFSVARDAFEIYRISTRSHPAPLDPEREYEPFAAEPVHGINFCPTPSEAGGIAAGLPADIAAWADLPSDALAVRAICGCRTDKHAGEAGGAPSHSVGTFVQLTVLRRGEVSSRIVHRWPDPLGEPIDPKRGDLLPAWLEENP